MRKIWIGILTIGILVLAIAGTGTFCYFEDVEISTGNIFQAGTWKTQADDCEIDTSDAFVSSHKLHKVKVSNSGESDIIIVKLGISWAPNKGEKVEKVWAIGERPAKIWEGNETSGAILDITDCTLEPGDTNRFEFLFDSKMEEKEFTIDFLMEDGSSKGVIFTP